MNEVHSGNREERDRAFLIQRQMFDQAAIVSRSTDSQWFFAFKALGTMIELLRWLLNEQRDSNARIRHIEAVVLDIRRESRDARS